MGAPAKVSFSTQGGVTIIHLPAELIDPLDIATAREASHPCQGSQAAEDRDQLRRRAHLRLGNRRRTRAPGHDRAQLRRRDEAVQHERACARDLRDLPAGARRLRTLQLRRRSRRFVPELTERGAVHDVRETFAGCEDARVSHADVDRGIVRQAGQGQRHDGRLGRHLLFRSAVCGRLAAQGHLQLRQPSRAESLHDQRPVAEPDEAGGLLRGDQRP